MVGTNRRASGNERDPGDHVGRHRTDEEGGRLRDATLVTEPAPIVAPDPRGKG
jgi:hypothetical protein